MAYITATINIVGDNEWHLLVGFCEGGPGIHHSVGKLLKPLVSKIDRTGQLEKLYLVHRLDKETTGVMVLAKYVLLAVEYRNNIVVLIND